MLSLYEWRGICFYFKVNERYTTVIAGSEVISCMGHYLLLVLVIHRLSMDIIPFISVPRHLHTFSPGGIYSLESCRFLFVKGRSFNQSRDHARNSIRHLATLKYQLDLSPLFLAHMYHHKDSSDYTKGTTTITGIKARLDRLFLDIHQRKEAKVIILKELQTKRRAMHMGINKARVDFEATDLRALAGTIQEVSPSELYEFQPKSKYAGGE